MKLIAVAIIALALPGLIRAEQYLRLTTGDKYLGRVSSADKNTFIFCDAKVTKIPSNATLEDTLETCGQVWVLDVPKYRLLAISEGASKDNPRLSKDALDTVVKIQDAKEKMSDAEIKANVGTIERQAGPKLEYYLKKGASSASSEKTVRP